MKGSLGIYFGAKFINIVETDGKAVLNNVQMSRASFFGPELDEKIPDELKMITLFKDKLREYRIDAKEAAIALSGKDLIIRTFELPPLPADELANAVNFEAKKYIPFKVEDLVSSYQLQFDRSNRKSLVLFVGIKKEVLGKYLSILHQLDIKVTTIEYSVFSILRLLQMTEVGRASHRGVIGIMNIDFQEENEVNFLVLDAGFPLFSRDITLIGRPDEMGQGEKIDVGAIIEKLKTEVRISLDYYDRKFSSKNIDKVFIFASPDSRQDLELVIRDVGLSARFIDPAVALGKSVPFSMSFYKGYGCSLSRRIKITPKIDLLTARSKVKVPKEGPSAIELPPLLADLRLDMRAVLLGMLVCGAVFGLGYYRTEEARKELTAITSQRPAVTAVNPDSSYDELTLMTGEYKKKLEQMNQLIRNRVFLTEQLRAIPPLVPQGMWLTNFSFVKNERSVEFTLSGNIYLGDGDKEFMTLNKFFAALKANAAFNKYFTEIIITTVDHTEYEQTPMTTFAIACHGAVSQ